MARTWLCVTSTSKTSHPIQIIHTTTSHLFWDPYPHYGWIPAKHLKPGMHLKTPNGQSAVVVGGSVPAVHEGWMWDLTVPGNNDHDFYVLAVQASGHPHVLSAIAESASILVHNDSCPTIGRDLIDGQAQKHIISGDLTGGGHKWPGMPGKTVFPPSWDTEEILNGVAEVATDPNSSWTWQKGATGSLFTRAGDPSRVAINGVYNGVSIRVIYEPATGRVITGFPVP